jgi:hypothetical protein
MNDFMRGFTLLMKGFLYLTGKMLLACLFLLVFLIMAVPMFPVMAQPVETLDNRAKVIEKAQSKKRTNQKIDESEKDKARTAAIKAANEKKITNKKP